MAVAEQQIRHKRTASRPEIVLMEDEDMDQIIKTLDSMECDVYPVSGRDEAVKVAEQGLARFFILDIMMGDDHRFTEGMDTLEVIKRIDSSIFVAIYTRHPRPEYKRQAENLGADLFVDKAGNIDAEMSLITAKVWPRYTRETFGQADNQADEEQYSPEFALNYHAFQRLLADRDLFAEHYNYFVAFIDGRMVRSSRNEDELLSWLIENPTRAPKFYALVQDQDDEPVECLPSPLFIEDR